MSRSAEIINSRRLAFGPQSKLMAISPMKHKWAREMWTKMLANNWTANEVSLTDDGPCYRRLTEGKRDAFDSALAFVSNLDGIQLFNLTNIEQCITSPEVLMLIKRQEYEEALHVDSYSQIVETVSADPMDVYMRFERDGILAEKNAHIIAQAEILAGERTHEQFARAIVANMTLEGQYFYSAFLLFYMLGRGGEMTGSSDMIKFINRDEITHLHLFKLMHHTHKAEEPGVYNEKFYRDAYELVRLATELETKWGKYIIRKGFPGLSDLLVEDYNKHRANEVLALMGLAPLYQGVTNPFPWVEQFADPAKKREKNFFESKVVDYSVGVLGGWD
ncbi:ribonucleotide-diphosphate reductase subunit beta [Burkholderia gladioli]|uniref:ribonucleotide-diphosphate reductase subunit beta n=1 Tax=Burkholderia gladioli TaxID=28095 RepID=UPI003B5002F3